jgi:hypothetical protein
MNLIRSILGGIGLACSFLLLPCLVEAVEVPGRSAPELANFDKRAHGASMADAPSRDYSIGLEKLKAAIPGVRIDRDEILGTPAWIVSTRGFLSGPGGQGLGIAPETAAAFPTDDPNRAIKAFLQQHRAIFGHGPEVLQNARVKREFVTPHNGLRTVIWEQQFDGIPVFEGLLIAHTTKANELAGLSSHFLPDPAQATGLSAPDRAALEARPPITAQQAIANAAQNIGEALAANEIMPLDAFAEGAGQRQKFQAAPSKGAAEAQLVWFPLNRNSLRLCWEIVLMSRGRGEMFQILIDARTGEALLRHSLTESISNASYRVFLADSPTPLSPGYSTPQSTAQPPAISRLLVVTNAFDTNASPSGWINDGDNETLGNNVDARLDRNADEMADIPRPRGSPFRVFDFPLDLTQDPVSYSNACVVNLFFWCNWMHDRLYEFGFTEAAGNFQANNFGRGGQGNDPIIAEAQDGANINSFNNDTFSTPPDGASGRMEMYLFNGPTPNRDSDFDMQIILHEYAHGLSNRRVGGGVGISALQSRGLGEGWSDFYSLALSTNPTNDPNANYPEGGYVAYQLYGGLTNNYYFGIRHYPYTTDLTKDPVTFKDIDPGQAYFHVGVPRNPVIPDSPTEVHNQGEVWCAILWDARANLIAKYGPATGSHLIIQLVTDALNLTPANPNFIQARDAIIQADLVDNNGANYRDLWAAFTKRGLGDGASAPNSSTTSGVIESFSAPDDLLITSAGSLVFNGTIGGPFTPVSQVLSLQNTGTNMLNWSAGGVVAWLSLSRSNGALAAGGGSTNVAVSISPAAAGLPVGNYGAALVFTNLASGHAQTQTVSLIVSPPRIYFFSLGSDPGWPRQGQWAFGVPAGSGGSLHGNPDPTAGATGSNVFGVNLNGDYSTAVGGPFYLTAGPLDFTRSVGTTLRFQRWLNTDVQPYASATIDVSADGVNWTQIFSNDSTEIADSSWVQCLYDMSAIADGQPSVYVRWGYQIGNGAFPYSGWNIDDIEFLGTGPLKLFTPASATEGDGVLAGGGTVAIAQKQAVDVVVSLASGNTSKITLPASVIIPAGRTNAAFDITIVDNSMLDGDKIVGLTASAPGFSTVTNFMTVFDNETATLTLSLPSSATEGVGTVQGTITCSATPAGSFVVSLASSDTNRFQVPASVVLPAGQTSVPFNATVIDDRLINGDEIVTVTAHVRNWTDGVTTITIHDDETTNLVVTLPAQARASNGLLTNAGFVHISGTLPTNLVANLASDTISLLTVSATATIPAGKTSAPFSLTLINDNQPRGAQLVNVTASAAGFASGSAAINVIDNQTPPVPNNPRPADLSVTNTTPGALAWSPGLGEGVEQIVNGGFETGDFSGWVKTPGTDGDFVIDDGTVSPPSADAPTPPFDGNFSAFARQTAPGLLLLRQDVTLPANAPVITLSWADRVRNFAGDFDTNQQFRVEVRNTNDVTLAVLFATKPGDTLLADWTQRNADLSSYSGQIVRLAFIVDAGQTFLEVHLDDISLKAASPPLTTYDVYFGTNSNPGPADFQGSATNTSWSLPALLPFTTYYWQIVARRLEQTTGAIWRFTSWPALSINNVSLRDGAAGTTTNAVFTVSLFPANALGVTVNYSTADGTATAGADYIPTNGALMFNPGETNKTISVTVMGDNIKEFNENFFVNLWNPANAVIGTAPGVGTLLDDDTNNPPVLAPISDQTVNEQTLLTFTATASDPDEDGETLTFTLDPGAPAGAGIDPSSGVFAWTPSEAQGPGVYTITVRVTDNGAPPLSAAQSFKVTVNEVNTAPVLSPIADQVIHAESTLTLTNHATDSDIPPNTLTFSLDPGAPTGAGINPSTGVFTWTPDDTFVGSTNNVTVRVTDNGQPPLSDFKSFLVAVLPRPTLCAIVVSGNSVNLSWTAIAGKVYRVQYKSDWAAAWASVPGDITASGPVATKTDASGLVSRRFYRILLVQ